MTRREYIINQTLAITGSTLSPITLSFLNNKHMQNHREFEVIIIGGSYAGLSAAMALGRSLRKTLIIDSGLPCNRYTPHAHNLITHDGAIPAEIAATIQKSGIKIRHGSVCRGPCGGGRKNRRGLSHYD